MRISDAIAPLGLFLVGLGLASALAFDGARSPNEVAPALNVDPLPRTAMTSPLAGSPSASDAGVAPGGLLGFNSLRVPDDGLKLTPVT